MVTVSLTMPHGRRLNLTHKTEHFPRKAIGRLGWERVHLLHRSSKFTDPVSSLSYCLAPQPQKCFCLRGLLQEGAAGGVACWGAHWGCLARFGFCFLATFVEYAVLFWCYYPELNYTRNLHNDAGVSLQCCRAILVSPSVNLRAAALERLLNLILQQHICFASCSFEGQPFAHTAFASFPACVPLTARRAVVISLQ